jgi:hypothetical protein
VSPARRRQIGGWAALIVALVVPLQALVLVSTSGSELNTSSLAFLAVEIVRAVALLVAAWGLHELYRSLDPRWSMAVLKTGVIASLATATLDLGLITGLIGADWIDSGSGRILVLAINVLGALWYLGAGLLLARSNLDVRRLSTAAQFGGLGGLLGSISLYLSGMSPEIGEAEQSILRYAQLLGLFVAVYLIRIWRYATAGRLPGPGLI